MNECLKSVRGVTLIELSVVLLVIVALAGVTLPYLAGVPRSAACSTTDVTLANIRDAIMGGGASPGFKANLGMMPSYVGMNPSPYANPGLLSELFTNPVGPSAPYPAYNPNTRRGWNGPYLSGGFACQTTPQARFCNCNPAALSGVVFSLDSFHVANPSGYCNGAPIVDPIELRIDSSSPPIYFLVSGGPNGQIDTASVSNLATRSNDDRVLVLNAPDPGTNQPCDQ